jgi:hypothetical protein
MDLTQFLLQQAQILQKQLQTLLEKSEPDFKSPGVNSGSSPDLFEATFEVTTDLVQFDSIGEFLPLDLGSRAPLIFTRLHPYFDGGVLFHKGQDSWNPCWAFQRGFCFQLTAEESKMEFEFPSLTLTEVKRAKTQAVINDLGLEEYFNNDKIQALVFRPHPEYLFLMLSQLAEPWLKLQMDRTQSKVLSLLSDYR